MEPGTPTVVALAFAKVVVSATFAVLARRRPHPALRAWSLAFFLDGSRHLMPLATGAAWMWSLSGLALIVGSFTLLYGAMKWAGLRLSTGWYGLAGIAACGTAVIPLLGYDHRVLWVPVGAFLAVTRARSGVAVARSAGDPLVRGIAGGGLLVLAALAVAYPLFVEDRDLLTWGFVVVTLLVVAEGFALMLLYFDRLRLEAEAQQRELRSVFDGSGQNIAVYDEDGRILRMNPSFRSIIGRNRNPRIDENLVPDPNHRATFFHATDFSSRPVHRVRLLTQYGGERDFDISVSSLPEQRRYMVFAYDVSKTVALERQLEESRRLEALGRVATGVAHDFNNVLNVINTYVGMARVSRDPKEAIRGIVETTRRAERLTQKLRSLGRKQKVDLHPLRIDHLTRDTAAWLERILGDEFELEVDLPEDESLIALGDVVQFEQLLFNLVTNAREVMPDGGRITISARSRQGERGSTVCLEVRDRGPGIPPEVREHMFDPFFSTKKGAAGLGLATVWSIVQDRGWWLQVADGDDGGTVFRIEMPRTEDEGEQEVGRPELETEERASSPLKVMLVDDNTTLIKLVSRSLRHEGHRVEALSSSSEALARLREERYDALVTDLDMPGMDGQELMRRAWDLDPELNVIVASGFRMSELPDDPRLQVLSKPYSGDSLRASFARVKPRFYQ